MLRDASAQASGAAESYVLCLEYLGGLIPILIGRRVSKLRPEFVVSELRLPRRHLPLPG